MPNDGGSDGRPPRLSARQTVSTWFALPPPLKRLFDQFPLTTYTSNDLPISTSKSDDENLLFSFTTPEHARRGAPSFNPGCLKWQTYLKIKGIDFKTVVSSNHASPTGVLPFLVTSRRSGTAQTISTKSIKRWITAGKEEKREPNEDTDSKLDTYQALIYGPIRLAWLHQLYLNAENQPAVQQLYLAAASSNILVQMGIAYQLKQAAEAEMRKSVHLSRKDEEGLYNEVEDAFFALSTLLSDQLWFGGSQAGSFDAGVFAYVHLILDETTMHWQCNRLAVLLQQHKNLIEHRNRILKMYY